MITVHNSLTGQKEELEPLEPGRIRMYVCGMTVYDLCHIGHARAFVVFDVIARYLERLLQGDAAAQPGASGLSLNTLAENGFT